MKRAYACFLMLLALTAVACNAQLEDAIAAHRKGDYGQAIAIYRRALEREPTNLAARKGLGRALLETGKYDEAVQALQGQGAGIAHLLGDLFTVQGKLKEAEQAYRQALSGPDSVSARLSLAIMQYNRGEKDAALREFDKFIDIYNNRKLTADELLAVGTAVEYLGERDPQLYKDALRAYDEAAAADPYNEEVQLRLANLWLLKYNSTEAQRTLANILGRNPNQPRALLALALAKLFDGAPDAGESVKKALDVNPKLVDAHVFNAHAHLMSEDYPNALETGKAALAINPNSLEALSVMAAAYHFSGQTAGFERLRNQILALNPKYTRLFVTLGEHSVNTRQYARAVDFGRQAVAIDSTAWLAHGMIGINQMRLGQVKEGRAALERAFAGDPYNVWFKNTLDLLDTMDKFAQVDAGRFQIALDAREADLLAPYVTALAEEAYTKLSQRYKTQLTGPVRIELFKSHADFSVRTVGLAGLGALGAAFGNVLVMDAPSAREAGDFNWGSTLWHELAHSFHLALSDHRVPRWLTEGLASYEERRAKPGWGEELVPGFVQAIKSDKLLPVSKMNRGFVRPEYPQQVAYSYHQASLVAEMIERDYGFDAILGMLRAYRDGRSNEEVFRTVLKTEPEAFDKKFDNYLKQRFATQIMAVRAQSDGQPSGIDMGDYASQLTRGQDAIKAKNWDEAIKYLERAKQQFPEWAGGDDNPYRLLAIAYREKGDLKKAAAELEQLTARNETDYEANLELAEMQLKANNPPGAAAALERAIYIYPMQPGLHLKLADLYKGLGDKQKVIRERKALLALNPVDKAEAHYQLALAYFEAGDSANARREVLRALEEAPSFEKAQELLLRLRS